jgi:hypothetical protein
VKLKTLFALSVLSLALTSSEAAMSPSGGTWSNVTVVGETACTAARCPPHGWMTFQLSANATSNPPDCSRDNRNQVAVDSSEGTGGGLAVMILSMSVMTGETLTISGAGNCGVDAVIETLAIVTKSSPRNK